MTALHMEPEQRREHRQRVLKGGAILGANSSEIRCTVRNMHAHGAELLIPLDAAIPQQFLLYISVDGIAYRCQLRWRKDGRCGVEFTGTEPKPRGHYG